MGLTSNVHPVRILVWNALTILPVLTAILLFLGRSTPLPATMDLLILFVSVFTGTTAHHRMLLANLVIIRVRFVKGQIQLTAFIAITQLIELLTEVNVCAMMGTMMEVASKSALIVTLLVWFASVPPHNNVLPAFQPITCSSRIQHAILPVLLTTTTRIQQ